MASTEEIRAQLVRAMEMLNEIAGKVGSASTQMIDVQGLISMSFEGSGRSDFLEIIGRAGQVMIELDDQLITVMSLHDQIERAAASL